MSINGTIRYLSFHIGSVDTSLKYAFIKVVKVIMSRPKNNRNSLKIIASKILKRFSTTEENPQLNIKSPNSDKIKSRYVIVIFYY